ncbi:single-stranded DNA-binding protein [Fodinicola feengrottensis]|uniref:Single-stranded DNA-binding protein n=1 Tax=Fodinicola feengrottensis TaxID=435914 RepID=A0ABN2GWA0_9ACTN
MSEESSTVEAPPAEQLVEGAVDGGESTEDGTGKTGPSRSELLIQEGDIAADYLERLLDIVDYDGDIDMDVEGDRAMVAVVGRGLQSLIGPGGATLDALQELTRLAVVQETGTRSRLMLDVGGYRDRRRAQLVEVAKEAVVKAKQDAADVRLDAMNPFERKVVHDAIADLEGVWSESEGEEPDRRVVVRLER